MRYNFKLKSLPVEKLKRHTRYQKDIPPWPVWYEGSLGNVSKATYCRANSVRLSRVCFTFRNVGAACATGAYTQRRGRDIVAQYPLMCSLDDMIGTSCRRRCCLEPVEYYYIPLRLENVRIAHEWRGTLRCCRLLRSVLDKTTTTVENVVVHIALLGRRRRHVVIIRSCTYAVEACINRE